MQDLKDASNTVIRREFSFLQHIKDKQYLQGEELSFRLSEFIRFSIVAGESLTAEDILDRIQDVIKRLQNIGILINLEYGDAEMESTIFTCKTNKDKLEKYFEEVKEETLKRKSTGVSIKPVVDEHGNLIYKGGTILFKGKELELVEILIKNLGKIVSRESLFEKIYQGNFESKSKTTKKALILENLDALFKSVKIKITQNKILKSNLILAQQDGFGIFLSQQ